MKRLTMLSFFAMTCFSFMVAQELPFIPVCREGVKWVYVMMYRNSLGEHKRQKMTIEFIGDSVVDGTTYKKCVRSFCGCQDNYAVFDKYLKMETSTIGLCREFIENGKQYFNVRYTEKYKNEINGFGSYVLPYNQNEWTVYYLDPEAEHPLEAFITQIKEHYLNGEPFYWQSFFYHFDNETSIEVNGTSRYCLKYEYSIVSDEHWIEGIGYYPYAFPANVIVPGPMNYVSGYATDLNHVEEDGKVVYKDFVFDEHYVDLPSGINDVKVGNAATDSRYYNLQGQAVDIKSAPAGIYIHNGKKIVVK